MNKEEIKISPNVQNGLDIIKNIENKVLNYFMAITSADNGKMFDMDLFAFGALKKTLSISAGFISLIQETNLIAARALVRIHLDTLLRFYAAWLVDNPADFAHKVISGIRIDKLKDKNGKRLTDRYLVEELTKQHEWIERVYTCTCGYIHLSQEHFFSTVTNAEEKEDSFNIKMCLGTPDDNYPEFSYKEAIDCFIEITDIFFYYIEGWIYTKDNPGSCNKKEKS